MLLFKHRYDLLELSKNYRLPKVYDLLNTIKNNPDVDIAATDGTSILINLDNFNNLSAESEFFIICHELLHILYHHLDEKYYPKDKYDKRELLNMCQDVIINEFLAKRLKYKEPNGLYLDNISKVLNNRGYLSGSLKYNGTLTTKELYDFINRELYQDDQKIQDLLNDIDYDSSDDRLEKDEDSIVTLNESERLEAAISNIKKTLKITDELIDKENKDKESGFTEGRNGTTSSAPKIETVSTAEMIKYINQFIADNAVEKGRHRTYTRPSRRVNLSNDMLAPGYKHYKNIKRIAIYLDVSGSMHPTLVSNLYDTLRLLFKKVEFDLYTFTVSVSKVDIKNNSSIRIGGGTNINNVLKHINDTNQDVAIMITDCEDKFSLKGVNTNLMIYTNDTRFVSDNSNVKLTYFK